MLNHAAYVIGLFHTVTEPGRGLGLKAGGGIFV